MADGEDTDDTDAPEDVKSIDLDTDDGTEVIAQQNVGSEESEGGGEWPDPRTPPQPPAPGAVDD